MVTPPTKLGLDLSIDPGCDDRQCLSAPLGPPKDPAGTQKPVARRRPLSGAKGQTPLPWRAQLVERDQAARQTVRYRTRPPARSGGRGWREGCRAGGAILV